MKSKVPIDFSKVEVSGCKPYVINSSLLATTLILSWSIQIKLVSPEGIQKYQTECAPNNGYFMVPFVDKVCLIYICCSGRKL